MRYQKYSAENRAWLGCRHFNDGYGCCSSCHEDAELLEYNFPLGEVDHPDSEFITATVCCAVTNNYLDSDVKSKNDLIEAWELALKRYEEEWES